MAECEPNGLLNLYKPVGLTSFGVVARLRRLTGLKRIGHCGTLDPFAEGVLPLCLGRGTAAVQFMEAYDKTYLAEVCLGEATDSEDCTGQSIALAPIDPATYERLKTPGFLEASLARFLGPQTQIPPMYSAIKQGGIPLYQLARKGQTVARPPRSITVYQAECVALGPLEEGCCRLWLRFSVSKGTYIRTLASDWAQSLGTLGHLTRLIRESCGPFQVAEALYEQDWPQWASHLLPIDQALGHYPAWQLSRTQGLALIQGKPVPINPTEAHALTQTEPYRIYGRKPDGEPCFVGLARPQFEPACETQAEAPAPYFKAERIFLAREHY